MTLRSGKRDTIDVHPDQLLKTASVAKLFLLVEVAERIAASALNPRTLLLRSRVDPVGDSGLWQYLSAQALPVEDAAALVGAASDNWATNVLLDLVGLESVKRRATAVAPGGSRLLDFVRNVRSSTHPETLSIGCAADWASFMQSLIGRTLAAPAVCELVLKWLAPALDLSMVASSLGLDPLAHVAPDRGVTIWNKTGTDDGVRADVGVVQGPEDSVGYAVICNWDPEAGDSRDAVLRAMRDIGSVIRELVT